MTDQKTDAQMSVEEARKRLDRAWHDHATGWGQSIVTKAAVVSAYKELDKAQSYEIERLKAEVERLRKLLRLNKPATTKDTLVMLREAALILLNEKCYDAHGWELIYGATEDAAEIIEALGREHEIQVRKGQASDERAY